MARARGGRGHDGRGRGGRGRGAAGAGPASPEAAPGVVRETNKRSRSARETEPKTDDVHDEAEDQEEDAEDEVSVDEEDHDETDDGAEIDEDDPVAMLIAQGVSEEMAKGALARSNGDLDAAVMLVIQWRELE